MPDTGAPWNIPYVQSSDLVSDWPADSLALANAIDSGLDAAGGLVAVKHALFTGTQTNSTAGGANFAVTDLSITHEVADAANSLIITATLGVAANSGDTGRVGVAVDDGSGLVGAGTASGSRTVLSAGGRPDDGGNTQITASLSTTFVITPGSGSKTYTVRCVNLETTTKTLFVNRAEGDADSEGSPRGISSLVIQEVKV